MLIKLLLVITVGNHVLQSMALVVRHLNYEDSNPEYCDLNYLNYLVQSNKGKSIDHFIKTYRHRCIKTQQNCEIDGLPFWYLRVGTSFYSYGAYLSNRNAGMNCKYIYLQLNRGNQTIRHHFVDIKNETAIGNHIFYNQVGTFGEEDYGREVEVVVYTFPGGRLLAAEKILTPRSKCEFDAMQNLIEYWIQITEKIPCSLYNNNYMQIVARQFCERALPEDKKYIKKNIGKYLVYTDCLIYFKFPKVLSTRSYVSTLEFKLVYAVPIGCGVLLLAILITCLISKRRRNQLRQAIIRKPDSKVVHVLDLQNLPNE